MKFWNFSTLGETEVELRIDGDIIDDDDVWLYEWLEMKHASPNAFHEELVKHQGKTINVWVNSRGGSVFAATGIYNALKEHAAKGGKVVTIGDAQVMSAATVIYMAGEVRKMSPGCVMMIHNPLTYAQGYASELRKTADILDTIKDTIINAYELSTAKSRDELSRLMDDETYMSAQTAIKEGFATEMLYGEGDPVNVGIPNVSFTRKVIRDFEVNDFNELKKYIFDKGETSMEIKNVEELREQYGELCGEVEQQAVKAERDRIMALDALSDGTDQVVKIINHAKESGQTAKDVEFFVNTAKEAYTSGADNADKHTAKDFINQILDNKNSGADGVGAEGKASPAQEEAQGVKNMVTMFNKKRGVQ